MSVKEAAVVAAADAWACAVEIVAEAEEAGRPCEDEQQAVEAAEFRLYEAVLEWRHARRQI